MDPKTLAVGQEVRMFTGHYTCDAKVVKVTSEGVIVDAGDGILRFNNLGKGFYINAPSELDIPGGPWFIEGVDWQSKDVIESTVDRNFRW